MGSAHVLNGLAQCTQSLLCEDFLIHFFPVGSYEKRCGDKHSQFIGANVSKLLNVLCTGHISMRNTLKYTLFLPDPPQGLGVD